MDTLFYIINYATLAVAMVIVSVPEGLPLAVSISLAYSVMRMKNSNILVKSLNSPEIMGGVDEICTGKTGTLTKGEMKVAAFYAQTRLIKNSKKNTFLNCDLFDHVIEVVKECILWNCEAHVEIDQEAFYKPVGNGTECGLITFLQQNEIPIQEIIMQKEGQIETTIPFSSIKKRMVVAVRHPTHEDMVRIYVKGAPEIVLGLCKKTIGTDGSVIQLSEQENDYILTDVLQDKFSQEGYRNLALAYKEMAASEFETLKEQNNNFANESDRHVLEQDLTLAGVFALKDNLREKVQEAISFAKTSGSIAFRMISGDSFQTAKTVAIEAGIITKEESENRLVCMTSEELRQQVGEPKEEVEADGRITYKYEKEENLAPILAKLKVLARSTPQDKFCIVEGIKARGMTVAMTGESHNDAQALEAANVGFSLGVAGCETAKDAADMILMNDNFSSTIHAVMWGRNIYANIRKFLLFQMTVNMSVLVLVFLGCALQGESPFSIVQLLLINLVMDILAALALATEPPHPKILKDKPTKMHDDIFTPVMWRQILGISVYQIVMLLILMIFGQGIYDLPYESSDKFQGTPNSDNKLIHYTMLFNTFMFMQIFNSLNCRKLGINEINIFESFFNNWLYLLIVGVEIAAQIILINYFGFLIRAHELTSDQHAACILLGFGTLIVSTVLKFTPAAWCDKIPIKMDENVKVDDNDKVMRAFNMGLGKSQPVKENKLLEGDDMA